MKEIKNKDIHDVLKEHEQHRDSLIPILQGFQKKMGYISGEALEVISSYLNISENEIFGVATFYKQFKFTRPGDHIVKVCQGTSCHVRGSKRIMNETTKYLGIGPEETTQDHKFSLESVACFGSCALSPIVVIDDMVHGRVTAQKIKILLKEIE